MFDKDSRTALDDLRLYYEGPWWVKLVLRLHWWRMRLWRN